VQLVIQLHPHRYPNGLVEFNFIGMLLLNTSLTWFTPLLEQQPPLSNDLKMFVEEFITTFEDFDKKCTLTSKLWALCQGPCPTTICIKFQAIGLQHIMGWNNIHELVSIWTTKWCEGPIVHHAKFVHIESSNCSNYLMQ